MKVRILLEIDESELALNEEELLDKNIVHNELIEALYEKINSYDDWCELYEIIEDDNNVNTKENNKKSKRYCLWATYDDEVRKIANQIGLKSLTEEQVTEVIYKYQKKIEWYLCDYWEEFLRESINEVISTIKTN